MERTSWFDRVKNEKDSKWERNILPTVRGRKAKWIVHILRTYCLLKTRYWREDWRRVRSDGGRRGRRITQLLDDVKETILSWKSKEEAVELDLREPGQKLRDVSREKLIRDREQGRRGARKSFCHGEIWEILILHGKLYVREGGGTWTSVGT
jgi:hypothetical protein